MVTGFLPATRRHDFSKFGQAFCEQFGPTVWISSRSALANGTGTLASTCGANPEGMVSAEPKISAITIAEKPLIITVPCHQAFPARRFVNHLITSTGFRM